MIYLIDTDVMSLNRRPGRSPRVADWIAGQPVASLHLSAITVGEIERGIERQRRANPAFAADLEAWLRPTLAAYRERILPFDTEAALIWGRLAAQIGNTTDDLKIAAIALAQNATVVTRNTADFAPTGCRVLDPFAA